MFDVQKRKDIWRRFLDLSSPVNRLMVITCLEDVPECPLLWWENREKRIDWSYEQYMRQLENTRLYDDHLVPYLSMVTGTEIFAEAFGCRVHRPLNNKPFALPLVHSAEEASALRVPRVEDTRFMDLFEMGAALKRRAGKDALLGLPDIQTPTDVAALIWEKSDFYGAMIEEPEAVLELIAKIRQFMFEVLDRWFETFGKEFSAHYPDYYMPFGITVSEDEIGVVNQQMYHRFFEEDLALFSRRYGQIGVHCCANSEHQWQNLTTIPDLKLINLVRNAESTLNSFKTFADVCAQMPLEVAADPRTLENSDRMHIANYLTVNTRREAAETMKRFYEKYPYMMEV